MALPLFHAYGVTVSVLLGVALAAKLVLLPKPEIGLIMDAVAREVPSFVPAVPPLYQRIVDEAERRNVSIRGIRYALSGAMPLPAALVERWEAATGGLLVEGYGLTETSPVIVGNPMSRARRPGAIGVPFPDVEIRIADPDDLDRDVPLGERGELLVRGPQVFSGYRGLPDETAAAFHDGWFRTRRRGDHVARRVPDDRGPDQGDHHHRRVQRLPLRGGGRAPHPRRRAWTWRWWASRTRTVARRWSPRWCSSRASRCSRTSCGRTRARR